MDKKSSLLNVTSAIISRIILLAAALVVRRLLIRYIGNDVNGLNALYSSIIGMLSVAELGIGSAIIYSMYKPVAENDSKRISALYRLYQRLYRIVGAVILCAGLLVMPFLPNIISDYASLNVNVYTTFLLTLISVVLSYMYGAKIALVEAYKKNYITTCILTISQIIRYVLQSTVIVRYRSFTLFLICQIIETGGIWLLLEIVTQKRYRNIISRKETVEPSTRSEIIRNIKAMFMHKLGTVLVNSVDNVIISAFIGVMILGKYSNYILISSVMTGIISLFFTSQTSVVGHLCLSEDKSEIRRVYDRFYALNYALGVIFYLGYYAVIDNVILMFFGPGLEMSRLISYVIALSGFINFLRRATLLFKTASGAFYYDRWKPVAEITLNLVLSLILVNVFPDEYKVTGVIIATINVILLISDVIEPYVLYRHVFKMSVKKFWIKNYVFIALFTAGLTALSLLPDKNAGLFQNGFISIGMSLAVISVAFVFDIITENIHGKGK